MTVSLNQIVKIKNNHEKKYDNYHNSINNVNNKSNNIELVKLNPLIYDVENIENIKNDYNKNDNDYDNNSNSLNHTNKSISLTFNNHFKERLYPCCNKLKFIFLKLKIIIKLEKFNNFLNDNKYEFLNKSLSICIHILTMILFEIYFFFDYVVDIENKTFIKKIEDTFNHFETMNLNNLEIEVIKNIILNDKYLLDKLYNDYIISKQLQNDKLNYLFKQSCKMTIPFGIIFILLLLLSLIKFNHINWKIIIMENVIMFLILGLFEYYFFLNIILKYEPVTNEEIKYQMMNHFFIYLSKLESINENHDNKLTIN